MLPQDYTICPPPPQKKIYIHSSKKVTQHDYDRLYFFYSGFLSIKLDIPRKPVYLSFD